jgi:hypothetical protein
VSGLRLLRSEIDADLVKLNQRVENFSRQLADQTHAELFLRTDSVEYTDISSERNTLTFLSGANNS